MGWFSFLLVPKFSPISSQTKTKTKIQITLLKLLIIISMELMRRYGFMEQGLARISLKKGVEKGSRGLMSIGRTLHFGAVFHEDLKVSETKIFDPQDKFLQFWNRLFLVSCILSVSCDPMFFYLPFIHDEGNCLGIEKHLAATITSVRTIIDAFYILRIILQFRTAFVAPSSRVFGRGELVIDPTLIAKRYLRRGLFFVDLLSILPLPQIATWRYLADLSDVQSTKVALLIIVLLQYMPRTMRIFPLASELKRTVGVFVESAFVGAVYYLFLYLLSSHVVGSFWYLLAVQRNVKCWEMACDAAPRICKRDYLYCSTHRDTDKFVNDWRNVSQTVLRKACIAENGENSTASIMDFGIYKQALESDVFSNKDFVSKYLYCLWWGLQNLSTLGQGLVVSMSHGEIIFSISIAVFGLVLFALLIGNMQTYLQSLTLRIEEMRLKRRDSEQWMHHRGLPQDLRERVRRYDQYRWVETRGVDEQSLVKNLPKDLRRDIKRHLCLGLVRRVPLFANMDEQLLDAICERLKPSLFTEHTYLVREEDPVEEMLFIIRGRLESATTDGGRSGFYNRSLLKEGDFCGDELLTWALDPRTGSHLPSSTRTVQALSEVEAFALSADDMKFVAGQFRRLHSRQVQHTFRYYSQQWRTWASCFIQAAWRRYLKRKLVESRRREEEEYMDEMSFTSSSLGATIYASRFATNALRGVRLRNTKSARELVQLQKPAEPDFFKDDDTG